MCVLRRGALIGLLLLLLFPANGCSETENRLIDDIGVTRLLLVNSGLSGQSVVDPDDRIQVAEWQIGLAQLSFDNRLIELVGETQPCGFSDTASFVPIAEGACGSGLLVEAASDDDVVLRLTLESMQVRRAEPVDLSLTVDFDADGARNDGNGSGGFFDSPCTPDSGTSDCDDNCPLVANADQADDDGNGVGNACTILDPLSGPLRDSDGDGVRDGLDNCVWIPNPDQADTAGLSAGGIVDGIGDACREQVATVAIADLLGNLDLLQLVGFISFVTVDFGDALQCDWDNLSCVLDPDRVEFCGRLDPVSAVSGC